MPNMCINYCFIVILNQMLKYQSSKPSYKSYNPVKWLNIRCWTSNFVREVVPYRGVYKESRVAAARSRRAAASEYVVSVPRVAGAEPLRRQACAAPGGTPPRAAPGQGALATGVTTATVTILHYI